MSGTPEIRVIIYGSPPENWMRVLSPGAPVWKELPHVKEVLMQEDEAIVRIPPASPGLDTVIIPALESHTLNCPKVFRSLIPDRRAVDTLGNKAAFAAYAEAVGLGPLCPPSYVDARQANYPCVLKCSDLHSGIGTVVVESLPHLRAHLTRPPWRGRTVVLQSLVRSRTDYVTHCVCKEGRILWHRTFSFEMESPATIRNPWNIKVVRPIRASARTLAQIEAFLKPLSYSGPCNVDHKFAESGDIVVFEINPRLGGSLMRPEHVAYLREALSLILDMAAVPA